MQTVTLDHHDEIIIPNHIQTQLDIAEGEYERGEFFKVDEAYFEGMKERVMKRISLLKPHV
jgi:hypothetical protein